jgi:predicted phosphodiesterase
MKAILSDVHANLEALRAVLDDASSRGADSVYNLGDIVGFGPNPIECIDLSMEMAVVLLGHFDHAVLFDPAFSPPSADASVSKSILWTRQVLKSSKEAPAARQDRVEFLSGLQMSHQEAGGVLYVHGSPRSHMSEYVFPEDIYNARKMARIGERFDRLCFAGHTHMPGIFVENSREKWQFIRPDDCGRTFRLDGRRVLCNVGSVGQPRDGDWRASYVTFDGATIQFRRVDYDREITANKMNDAR